MNIVQAVKDENLFRPYLQGNEQNLRSWQSWMTCLRVIYGLPLNTEQQRRLVRECTGRNPAKLPSDGFNKVLLLVGRRGGKSKISGLIASFEGLFSNKERLLSPGEIGMVTITSPTREQSTIIKSYTRAACGVSPMLDAEVDGDDTRQGFKLNNGIHVRILTGDFRTVRGFTQLAVVVDELAFFGVSEESRVRSDTELIRAIKPALLTTKGRFIGISTKYWAKGYCYNQWKRHWGNDSSRTLVWDATSRTMNPTLSQEDIDDEIADDPESARAEFLNEWREDVAIFLPREVIESVVVANRTELLPRSKTSYRAFCDMSGGRSDSATLTIAHRDGRKIVQDFLREWRPPFSPYVVIGEMSDDLKRYRLRAVTGDKYSAEFVVQAFRNNGIHYNNSVKNKSELYLELLPRICSKEIELLDSERLILQLSNLERRTRSGGKDSIDHGPNGHDDLSNVTAGVSSVASKQMFKPRAFSRGHNGIRPINTRTSMGRALAELALR